MASTRSAAQAADPGAGLSAAPLVVIGGGEHARVLIDAARSTPGRWSVQGYVAPGPTLDDPSVAHLGDDEALSTLLAAADPEQQPWLILGFGGSPTADGLATRMQAAARFGSAARWATVVHASAWVSPSAVLAPGAAILAGAVVNTGATVERHAIVNTAAVVEHDVVVGAGSHLAPGALVGGGTRIGEAVFIGLGARVRDHVEIGSGAIIGMGAVVLRSVAAGERVVGVLPL